MNRTRTAFVLLSVMAAATIAWSAYAQAPAAPAAAPAAAEAKKKPDVTLLDMWNTGGWCMYPIGLLSILGIGLSVFAWISAKDSKMAQPQLMPILEDAIVRADFNTASATCAGSPGIMTNILHSGLMRLNGTSASSAESFEKALEESALEENLNGLKWINGISIAASLAPMFGLLGTVDGMIKAFQKIGLGGMGDPEKLADDIGEAMITTWFGLVVGIPLMFLYFWLKGGYQAKFAKIARLLGNLSHHLKDTMTRVDAGEIAAVWTSSTPPAAPAPAAETPAQPNA